MLKLMDKKILTFFNSIFNLEVLSQGSLKEEPLRIIDCQLFEVLSQESLKGEKKYLHTFRVEIIKNIY